MKIAQKVTFSEDQMLIRTRHTATPAITAARALRDMGAGQLTPKVESVPVAVVPASLIFEWAKKHGVRYDDSHAMREVVDRELADPANSMFRVYGKSY